MARKRNTAVAASVTAEDEMLGALIDAGEAYTVQRECSLSAADDENTRVRKALHAMQATARATAQKLPMAMLNTLKAEIEIELSARKMRFHDDVI